MNYILALFVSPVAVWLSGARKQVILSAILWGGAIALFNVASSGAFQGAYAAAPVLYIASIIHAFIFTHRFYQQQSGMRHPHRGTATQSHGSETADEKEEEIATKEPDSKN